MVYLTEKSNAEVQNMRNVAENRTITLNASFCGQQND
jgi:hypothetical protein